MTVERKTHRPLPSKVQPGHLMCFVNFAKVKSTRSNGTKLACHDIDRKGDFEVHGEELVVWSLSADQYAEEVRMPLTAVAEILISLAGRPFTVAFKKANGEERVLRGRLLKHEALLGRSMVEDLDIEDEKGRTRLVDHRELKWLVAEGVKYVVK